MGRVATERDMLPDVNPRDPSPFSDPTEKVALDPLDTRSSVEWKFPIGFFLPGQRSEVLVSTWTPTRPTHVRRKRCGSRPTRHSIECRVDILITTFSSWPAK